MKDRSIAVMVLVTFSCICLAVGCGGGGSNTAGDAATVGAVRVSCPFSGSTALLDRADLASVAYYDVDLYLRGTDTPAAARQQVSRPPSGITAAVIFDRVASGLYSVHASGYDSNNILLCWSNDTVSVSRGGISDVSVTPTRPINPPEGYAMQQVTLTEGAATVTIDDFNSSSEAILVANYNSTNWCTDRLYPICTGGSATAYADRHLLEPFPSIRAVESSGPAKDEQRPFRDIEWITHETARCIEEFGVPAPVSRDRLRELGRLDEAGITPRAPALSKSFWIYNEYSGAMVDVPCTLEYNGMHSLIYVDDRDLSSFPLPRAQSVGKFFDEIIWQEAEKIYGGIPSFRWGDRIYIVFSREVVGSDGGPNAFFSPFNEYDQPNSNRLDMLISHPTFSGLGIPITDADFQGAVAHEFQHLMRWFQKVYRSGWPEPGDPQLARLNYYDTTMNEGLSQYFEIVVGRGFTNSPGDLAKWLRIDDLRQYLQRPYLTPVSDFLGYNYYAAGFMMMFYLVDHYGEANTLQRINASDGKLGLDSVQAVTGEMNENLFLKYSMALNLAATPDIDETYGFSSIDISGDTTYYAGKGLFPACYRYSNVDDFSKGIDMREATGPVSWEGNNVLEWSVDLYRFYNGRGQPLTINLTGFTPNSSNAGSFTIYVINR